MRARLTINFRCPSRPPVTIDPPMTHYVSGGMLNLSHAPRPPV